MQGMRQGVKPLAEKCMVAMVRLRPSKTDAAGSHLAKKALALPSSMVMAVL